VPARILIIDDDPGVAGLITQYLKRRGYEAQGLTDPRQALERLHLLAPNICILDLDMPYITGSELLDQIRIPFPEMEILILTAHDETMSAIDLMRRGASDYLLKPVSISDLDFAITRSLEHQRLLRENLSYRENLEKLVVQRTDELNRALDMLNHMHSATLKTLASALDLRDQATFGHSHRVADLTVGIARSLGISGAELVQIEHGALMHDIGKLGVPDSILGKPGRLTEPEWEIMRLHPEYGHNMLKKIDFLIGANEIVLTHHERFDGRGYPNRLKGEQVPLGSRIFAIVDTLDVLVHDRPYHQRIPFSQAVGVIEKGAGTQFDPSLIRPALDFIGSSLSQYSLTP
jgi:putative nucleotidyltransferase with HDIG domain